MNFLTTDQLPNPWNSDHAKSLRDFLQSDVGRLALDWIIFQGPTLLDGADVNKTLVASGEVKGYTAALSNLVKLTLEQPVAKPEEENYPDLDNDEAWIEIDRRNESKT